MHQTSEDRAAMDEHLATLARRRHLSWLTTVAAPPGAEGVQLTLRDPLGRAEEALALHHSHGRWLHWLAADC
jgi:Uncharacterized protein conserved in bacteria (DUF2332)